MNETNITPITNVNDDVTQTIFVTIEGEDVQFKMNDIGVTFEDSEQDIMNKVAPIIEESYDIDITDSYKVRKMTNSENIFIIPNSIAGI